MSWQNAEQWTMVEIGLTRSCNTSHRQATQLSHEEHLKMFATCKITCKVIQGYQKRSYSTDNIALPFLRHSETLVKTVHFTHPLVCGELPSVLWHCWFSGRKGIRPGDGGGGGGHWLVWMEWRPAGWSVWLPLLIFPCKISPEVLFLHRVT